jgi:hypothetical protein
MNTPSENPFEVYEREPVLISPHTVVLLQIFTGHGHFKDLWSWDYIQEAHFTSTPDFYERAAKQFVIQLEGHGCIAFYEALRDELQKHIDEHVARGGNLKADFK